MNRITINGKTITCSGTNVVINNGKVIVDGKQFKSVIVVILKSLSKEM